MTEEDIKDTYDEASEFEPEAPRPLYREVSPATEYPVDALGQVLGPAAKAINDMVQAPLAICAQSVLATATLAVQGFADVALPIGQPRPISQYFISVAESGERKTTADDLALAPVRQHEEALLDAHDSNLITYRSKRDVWDRQRAAILKSKNLVDGKKKEQALNELGSPPDPPLVPMLTVQEPTYEGLVRLLVEGQPSVGIYSSEGGRLIEGHAMSRDHRLKTAAGLSEIWDGTSIRRARQGDGAFIVPGRRVSMHLLVQPEIAMHLLADPMLTAQGLLSRILIVIPASASGTRMWHEPKPESQDAIKMYHTRLLEIFKTPLPLKEGKPNQLTPRRLPLSNAAKSEWIDFADTVEVHIGPGGPLELIRAMANKLPEHAARMAAVLALVDDLDCVELSVDHMEAGRRLAEFYASEAMRLVSLGATNPDLVLAAKLLAWLHGGWKKDLITLPDIYQRGPSAIRDKRTANHIVNVLVDHGELVQVDGGAEIDGKHRRDVWRIVKWTTD